MTTEHPESAERERRRNEVLAACLEDPVLAAEVGALLADRERLHRLAAPLHPDRTTLFTGQRPSGDVPPAPRCIGGYELLCELGRGGMGVVYKARQQALNRFVALKLILAGRLAGVEEMKRFRTEAESTARLRHPTIVAVHEVGETDGQLYFSMEFVEGRTLAQRLLEGPLPGRTAAGFVCQLARAVHYAHSQGILHRDIKPANVLLDLEDRPYLTDFGLAKKLDAGDSVLTQTGAVVGTPSYMAPEQAAGRVRELGPACDVWGLGALLYELLTGRPPFRSDTALETLLHVMERDPAPPRLLNARIDADLETICLKCLEKNPHHRYASADAVADELQRFANGDSIQARSYNVLARLTRALHKPSHREADMRDWSALLLWIAAIFFFGHLLTFVLLQTGQEYRFVFLSRSGSLVLGGAAFLWYRGRNPLPGNAAERQVWLIWLGALTAFGVSALAIRLLINFRVLGAGSAAPASWKEEVAYPISATVAGMAFFIMGGSYGSRYYAISLAFFVLALLLPFLVGFGALAYGFVWAVSLTVVALSLRAAPSEGVREIF